MPPGKRPSFDSDSGDDEVPKKKAKCSSLDARAGTIDNISMKNFMCHTSLEISLNKRINFVVGRNGSGKSAILSALVVALGSKAAATNRASSLKDFVKKGCQTSVVQVTLNNTGSSAYKQNVYGRKICISRTLHTSTSPSVFKIKSETGAVISTKREELQRIITAFNLQIDNPICILNQDTSRTFLAASDPKAKYTIFMKATRLDEIHQVHLETLQIEETGQRKLLICYDTLKHTEKQVSELEEQMQHIEKLKRSRNNLVDYENELFWARVIHQEKILSSMKTDFSEEEAIIKQKKEVIEKLNVEFEEAMDQIRSLKKDADSKLAEIQETKEKLDEVKKKEKISRAEYTAKLRIYKDVKGKIKHHHREIDAMTKELNRLRAESASQNIARKKIIQEKLASLVKDQEMLKAVQRTTNQDYEKLQGEEYHYRESYSQLKASQADVLSTIERKKRELATLKNQKSNLSLYAPWMGQLCRKIEDAHKKKKFVRKPVGPLGLFIKVRERKWVQGIESEIGLSFLRSFFCHCKNDMLALKELISEVVPPKARSPGIIVSDFHDKLHNIRGNMARCQGYTTMYEMLDISDVNAANCLIDCKGVENILLIPTHAEAARLMSDKKRPHKNCKRCITLAGDVYYPYPDYKTYASSLRTKSHLLQMSTQDTIRHLEEEIIAEQQKLGSFEVQLNDLREKMNSNKKEIQRVQRKQKEIGDKKSKTDAEIKDLQESLEASADNMHALESELADQKKRCSKITEEERVLDLETKKIKADLEAAVQEAENLQKIVMKADEEKIEIMNRVLKVKEKVKNVDMKRKEAQRMSEVLQEKIREAEQKYQVQKEKFEKVLKDAQEIHPERIETQREIPEIESDIKCSRSYVAMAEKSTGNSEDIAAKLAERRAVYGKYVARFNSMKKGLKVLRASLRSRKALYFLVREVMALKVLYMFRPLMRQRGFKGDLEFNHEARTLTVLASPENEDKSRETKSLSGGERSYSTIAFLLSLWECVETPFYFLDEFDVFMDRMNRQVAMELLLFQARQKKLYQYVFLTPQGLPSIKDAREDIAIHHLDDPEREKKS